MVELRKYQLDAVDQCRQALAVHRKVLLHLPTGAGKGIILSEIMRMAVEKGRRVLFVVHGRELVRQASNRLGLPHNILMAGSDWSDSNAVVASIDTMHSRSCYPDADLVVIDEAHLAGSSIWRKLAAQYESSFVLGVTATPYQRSDLGHIAKVIVAPIDYQGLVSLGHLIPSRTFAPNPIDRKIKVVSGDFSSSESEIVMRKSQIVGDTVEQYIRFGESRSAIVFCVTKRHARDVADKFISRGIKAEVITADTPDDERREILERSKNGITNVICNVMVLSVGVDMPWVSCVVMARPTKSEIIHVQALGRGSRPFPGKKDFIVIDQAGNTLDLGFIEQPRQGRLIGDASNSNSRQSGPVVRTCKKCLAVIPANAQICTECKSQIDVKEIKTTQGSLSEITTKKIRPLSSDAQSALKYYFQLKEQAKVNGYKPGWIWFRLKARFSESTVQQVLRAQRARQGDPA